MEKISSSNKRKSNAPEKDLDCTNAARGVWLVKVPKYMSSRWQKAPPLSESGRVRISKSSSGRTDINFSLSDVIMNIQTSEDAVEIPKQHQFVISQMSDQNVAVFSQGSDKLMLEGHVVQRGECRPIRSAAYMSLKKQTILKASQPERQVKQIRKAVNSFKPVSDHKHNIEFEARKKAEGKKSRDDKEKVQGMLFGAFEKHQYYNIKDLEKITRQPITYLKEILKEICNYNAKNPHKSMWELKPEYRCYKEPET